MKFEDFKNTKKTGMEYVTEISIPSIKQFKKFAAKRFLEIYGPRKLCSFIQRCNGEGPWAETIVVWKKDKWGDSKKYIYSKLELELVQLQNLKRAKIRISESSLQRYEELLVTMSPDLMKKTDENLLKVANEWISKIKDSVDSDALQ